LQQYSPLKGGAEGVPAGNNWLDRLEYLCLGIERQFLVGNLLEVREFAVLLRRFDVVDNVYKRTKRPVLTPCL
jgi:hypothetical protein